MTTETTKKDWLVEAHEDADYKVVWVEVDTEGEALHIARKLAKNITNNYKLITVVKREVTTTLNTIESIIPVHDEEE